ncbi:PcfA protein [Enterococcus faecalis]|uniref:PcfA protein n=2 Tax=Enterococcus faecalis TaxID=1351 RepID=UPI001BD9C0BD|nr:PcfA protein [Enterococcus faecalis]MBT0787490.1 PcfA protein [Enterococcus faecalis]
MSKFFSKEYRYDLLCSANIKKEPINSVEALINFVIGANNRIINQKEQGWIYAEKVRVSGPDETILYGKRVDLPLLEDNPYFDKLLSAFHTKKVIPFVELLPSSLDNTQENQDKPEEKTSKLHDIVESEGSKKDKLTTEERETTELKKQPDEMADKETQKKILEQKIQFKKDELATLTEEIATKQEEINDLEQKLSTFSKKSEGLYL